MKRFVYSAICIMSIFDISYADTIMRVVKNDGEIVKYKVSDVNFVDFEDDVTQILPQNHDFVDLGLPSGTLWATCNVGASSQEEYGDYFAWGETSPKSEYFYNTHKWYCEEGETQMQKYNEIDGLTVLLPEDDAATVNWGEEWRMPTESEIRELEEKCTYTWIEINGVGGGQFTGPNGNSIFVPASGDYYGSKLTSESIFGYFWSSSLMSKGDRSAYYMGIFSTGQGANGDARGAGKPVRAVRR